MNQYKLVKHVKENNQLRQSFNELAEETFGINFEKWYELGFWEDNYIPYAFVSEEEVIANASITKSELVINEKIYQVIQVGTVMTKEKYRSQGLSKKLMEEIIKDYQDEVDFIYLFANETVLDFYPKFGFKRVDELATTLDISKIKEEQKGLVPVNFERELDELRKKSHQRNNEHLVAYLENSYSLSMFYYSTVFLDELYYIQPLDTYVCFEIEGNELHLFDCLSDQKIELLKILNYLPLNQVEAVHVHFQLKDNDPAILESKAFSLDDDALFILNGTATELELFKLPLFNHA